MKKLLFTLTVFCLLCSCTESFDITAYKDRFPYKNVQAFDVSGIDYSETARIEDKKLLEFLWQNIAGPEQVSNYLDEYNSHYFFSYQQSRRGLQEFAIANTTDCESFVHYVILSEKGEFVNSFPLANSFGCGDTEVYSNARVVNDSTFRVFHYSHSYFYDLLPSESLTTYSVGADGVVESDSVALIPAVCLWERLSVREAPEDKAKSLTTIRMAEKVYDLGERMVDANSSGKNEYMKISLSDGTMGWVQSNLMASNARSVVATEEIDVYSRPDVLTKTEKKIQKMDIIALLELKGGLATGDGWFRVKSKPAASTWYVEGWIKAANYTSEPLEVSVASYTAEAGRESDAGVRQKKLREIISNTAFVDSRFLPLLKEKAGIQPEGITDYLELLPATHISDELTEDIKRSLLKGESNELWDVSIEAGKVILSAEPNVQIELFKFDKEEGGAIIAVNYYLHPTNFGVNLWEYSPANRTFTSYPWNQNLEPIDFFGDYTHAGDLPVFYYANERGIKATIPTGATAATHYSIELDEEELVFDIEFLWNGYDFEVVYTERAGGV